MIGVQEAQELIGKNCDALPSLEVPLFESFGCVTAADVIAPRPMPLFDNSAMDGFLLRSADTLHATPNQPVVLTILGDLRAGDGEALALQERESYRIMTGALIVGGGDAVLPKEKAVVKNDQLIISSSVPSRAHIRFRGEEFKEGVCALPKGSVINPGTIGFLASLGMERVHVYRRPRISVISTGSELTSPGGSLQPGKIYDSNLPMVRAALEAMHIRPVYMRRVPDKRHLLEKVISFALKTSDLVIVMGGVSVGEYDFVKEILTQQDVQTVFWKVSQKPGKPLYFGKNASTLVFGLPGNPAAVFTCFYEYVYPAIRRLMSYSNPYLPTMTLELKEFLKPDPEKWLFLKSKIEKGSTQKVIPLKRQQSHMISSLCQTDSFVVVPDSAEILKEGQKVLVHSLPFSWEGVL